MSNSSNNPVFLDSSIETPVDLKMVEISFHEKYNVFDVQLLNIPFLSQYEFIELDISFFPLSRNIASEHYEFEPFEHYIDETKNNKSMYRQQQDLWQHLSWFGTSALLTWIVANFNPKNITEIGSLVSLVASYFAGMKAWPNIESFLINKTAKNKLQFKERYFQYHQNITSTWEKYDNYAKKARYKMENMRPDEIGMVIDSIRQKMRLRFTKDQLLSIPQEAKKVNVMNISLSDECAEDFLHSWVQIGIHIKLWDRLSYFPIANTRTELIQSLICKKWHKEDIGCIYNEKDWFIKWYMEHRETVAIDRIKYYKSFEKQQGDLISYKYSPKDSIEIITPIEENIVSS